MAKISIDYVEATEDVKELLKCKEALDEAKNKLNALKPDISSSWKGHSANQCLTLIEGFVRQIDELTERTQTASRKINTISSTYMEADRKLASGGGSW